MKKVILIATVLLTMNVFADCAPSSEGSATLYPISADALEISVKTKLKTCSRSPRFAQVFKAVKGHSYKVQTYADYVKATK